MVVFVAALDSGASALSAVTFAFWASASAAKGNRPRAATSPKKDSRRRACIVCHERAEPRLRARKAHRLRSAR